MLPGPETTAGLRNFLNRKYANPASSKISIKPKPLPPNPPKPALAIPEKSIEPRNPPTIAVPRPCMKPPPDGAYGAGCCGGGAGSLVGDVGWVGRAGA